ncbi:MAG: RNA pseudouridine synthase [Flammeovirgaceae bacterium]|nr:RNA pseudouridine synthase [Flammeovirgaceae bacterium]
MIYPESFTQSIFHKYPIELAEIDLPKKFTFPFSYQPHPVALIAVKLLQTYLVEQKKWTHIFGDPNNESDEICGKMFGVLVVQNEQKDLGYLAAFSGKLAEKNHLEGFVGPIYDRLEDKGFFKQEEASIIAINDQIKAIELDPHYSGLLSEFNSQKEKSTKEVQASLMNKKKAKHIRRLKRKMAMQDLSGDNLENFLKKMSKESQDLHFQHKRKLQSWQEVLNSIENQLAFFQKQINELKEKRKAKSSALQQKLFDQYQFLNQKKQKKGLNILFQHTKQQRPPAGAGDCAAPKLLQYAFLHDFIPVALAEFWWGKSPKLELRRHGYFYPVCLGKCEPILIHMLSGMTIDENPAYQEASKTKGLDIIYESADYLVINKPNGLLSVSGKYVLDSVASRVKAAYPKATGPMMVHRLDRETSGLMVVAKTLAAYLDFQNQFLNKTIKKEYIAILSGIPKYTSPSIKLPLRPDHYQRPRQMVCYSDGKSAETHWSILEIKEAKARVLFKPITGRTHQLRVHSAHHEGLNMPIEGDELYGLKSNRLKLHATALTFEDPTDGKSMEFNLNPDF